MKIQPLDDRPPSLPPSSMPALFFAHETSGEMCRGPAISSATLSGGLSSAVSESTTWKNNRFAFRHGCDPPLDLPQMVSVTHDISPMRGGAQSRLMLGDDYKLWVVKFKNNPQHQRVLANEYFATRIAEVLGLSVPKSGIVRVSQALIDHNPQLNRHDGHQGEVLCSSGLHYGSQFAGGLMPKRVVDFLPTNQLIKVSNLAEFAGILAFDKWTGNSDGRQAVFCRPRNHDYAAVFVDQGACFGEQRWSFRDAPLNGLYAQTCVYSQVTSWDSFEPWLTRIEQFNPEALWEIIKTMPEEWYEESSNELKMLVEELLSRRSRVRELIDQLRTSDRAPFPNWRTSWSGAQFASRRDALPLPIASFVESNIQSLV